MAIGNKIANTIWEACILNQKKPSPSSSHEEKERWIKNKYELKEFLPKLNRNIPITQQLIEAIIRNDTRMFILLLAVAEPNDINSHISSKDLRTPMHVCCAMGNSVFAQLLIWVILNLLNIYLMR